MGVGQRRRAELPVDAERPRVHRLDHDRALPVAQLAHVVVALLAEDALRDMEPAEEDVARRLHDALPGDDALARILVLARADELLQHRALASLICRNSGSRASRPSSRATQAAVPTLPTPTTLRAESTSWNWLSRIRRSCGSVRLYSSEKPLPVGLEAVALLAVREVVEPDDQRRIGDDPPLAVDRARELRERLHVVALERLGDGLVEALAHLAADLRAQLRHQLLDLEAGVPDLEVAHPGELAPSACGRRRPSRGRRAPAPRP